ncbi:MAG TPA: type II toxin-antitoxin system VapB family antitoxin [Longimicrobium sp.]|nr:type II toxin-antitoxin system VapB family antitoxin [Longimicrobium sp.]
MANASSSRRRGRPADTRPTIRRKNLNIDQQKLDRVVTLLGARTETEAIDQALDLLLFQGEAIAGLRKLSGRGHEIENLFDEHLDL